MTKPSFVPLDSYLEYKPNLMKLRAKEFYTDIRRRRTVRDFSNRIVSKEIIENCIRAAGTAPNGANLQPWHFVAIADPNIKRKIRVVAEEEERIFYEKRAPKEWLPALQPLGTDWRKPLLTIAPYLLSIFAQSYSVTTVVHP